MKAKLNYFNTVVEQEEKLKVEGEKEKEKPGVIIQKFKDAYKWIFRVKE